MRVIILVLSSEMEVYKKLEDCIRETWLNDVNENIELFFYYGDSERFDVIDDRIFSTHQEGLYNIGYKTLDSYRYILENKEFDFIFRTNSSSYVLIENLIKFLENKPKNGFYCGYINKQVKTGINFASGSGYFLSKDVVDLVVKNYDKWNHSLIDDVALGLLLTQLGVKLLQSRRFDINKIDGDNMYLNDVLINTDMFIDHFHFRCKTFDKNRNDDVKIMRLLNNHFKNLDSL